MKIGILIPDRGDRPKFMDHCMKMMASQDIFGEIDLYFYVVGPDKLPPSNNCDITARYRIGYDYLSKRQVDLIFFVESDDWYSTDYIKETLIAWEKDERPDIFGTRETIYYHIKLKAWYLTQHEQRSCAMNTVIKPNLRLTWPIDHEPFTDIWLWGLPHLSKKLYSPQIIHSIGIKHGVGMTGGKSHIDRLHRYINKDENMEWLKSHIDESSFNFYKQYSEELNLA